MRHATTFSPTSAAFGFAVACLATAATAQGGWPTVADFYEHGQPVAQADIETLLTENLSIIGVTVGGAVMGYIGACGENPAQFIRFDAPFSALAQGTCRFEGNRVCGRNEKTTGEECIEVRRIGTLPLLFAEFTAPEGRSDPPENGANLPAKVLGIVEGSIRNLALASGKVTLGAVSLALPAKPEFSLSHARGFPVGVTFNSAYTLDGQIDLSIEVVGWPDPLLPGRVPDPAPDPQDPALVAEVEAWADDYASRPPGTNFLGMAFTRDHFETSPAAARNAACVRIMEQVSLQEGDEGVNTSPKTTLYLRQFCIAPEAGIMALISYAVSDQLLELAPQANRLTAEAILDSIEFAVP